MPMKNGCHWCAPDGVPSGAYGSVIDHCYEDEKGQFWVSNYEYESQVNFCPFCGDRAPAQADWATLAIEQEAERVKRREDMILAETKAREEREARAAEIARRDADIDPDGLYPCTDKVLEAAGWDESSD